MESTEIREAAPQTPAAGRRPEFKIPKPKKKRRWIKVLIVLAVLAAALNWTPINYQTLFGMQGRYLLPVLPLALLLWKNNRLVAMRRSAAHGAALSVALLTLLTQLQGFALYASWQPVS